MICGGLAGGGGGAGRGSRVQAGLGEVRLVGLPGAVLACSDAPLLLLFRPVVQSEGPGEYVTSAPCPVASAYAFACADTRRL